MSSRLSLHPTHLCSCIFVALKGFFCVCVLIVISSSGLERLFAIISFKTFSMSWVLISAPLVPYGPFGLVFWSYIPQSPGSSVDVQQLFFCCYLNIVFLCPSLPYLIFFCLVKIIGNSFHWLFFWFVEFSSLTFLFVFKISVFCLLPWCWPLVHTYLRA